MARVLTNGSFSILFNFGEGFDNNGQTLADGVLNHGNQVVSGIFGTNISCTNINSAGATVNGSTVAVAVPVSKIAEGTFTFTTTGSIDLTALIDFVSQSINGTGLKPNYICFSNPGANASVTLAKGASNGYTGLGANFSLAIPPGGAFGFFTNAGSAAVSAFVKTIDVSGTGTQTIYFMLGLG